MKIDVTRRQTQRTRPADKDLGFGKVFADHMFMMDHEPGKGWHSARVVPYGPLTLDPASAVFHYGQAMFEGLKAFRGKDDVVRIFRLDEHCKRLARGAERLCMPSPDLALLEDGIKTLVDVDRAWVPASVGTALYIRPTLIATEPFLGVRPSARHTFFVITSPVAAYYAEGLNPVKIWIEDTYVRASKGGLGAVKAGANYAASLLAAEEAKKRGYSQVLWLDAANHRDLEEVGTMNVFIRFNDEVATPALSGSILPGITRASVIDLLRSWGMNATERTITVDEIVERHKKGELLEVFGSGTAAVISPVGELGWHGQRMVLGDGNVGEVSRRLYEAITGIQYGTAKDEHGWLWEVPVARPNGASKKAQPAVARH
ncbi:MAG: branched-chain amino acid aminotransferase [Deltaproteobacteria bacterium]|nr:branched-chain amino acid aminotransferase [Deltaproteobacteria bacterium]